MTKLFFSKNEDKRITQSGKLWKLLVVDDEESIHQITTFALKYFEYNGQGLDIISAYSAAEAITKLREHPDIAVILLDVVMESSHAGLHAVEQIRNELKNYHVRIILRTGQPGQAPEQEVIEKYDINDYREKTELTQEKLYTTVRMGLKSYEYIITMQSHLNALEYIVQAAPTVFRITSLENMFRAIFSAAVDLIGLSEGSEIIEDVEGFIAYPVTANGEYKVCHSVNSVRGDRENQDVIADVMQQLQKQSSIIQGVFDLKKESFAIPITDKNKVLAVIIFEHILGISVYGEHLLNILAMQATVAFRNIDIYEMLSLEHAETINLLAVASEYKDEDMGEHMKRVESLAQLVAKELGMDEQISDKIAKASIMHDIGKLSVPDTILKKPGKLNKREFETVKRHTTNGAKILSGQSQYELACEIALSHHESYDGTGYPHGLKGDDIPVSGRIVGLVDVYDALTNNRPYKQAWTHQKAVDLIRDERGKKFDPEVVDAFMRLVDRGLV